MINNTRIYVAGGSTLVGRALLSRLHAAGFRHLIGAPPEEPDLTCARAVQEFFAKARPQYVFVAAGASAGIRANQRFPADLMLDNLRCAMYLIDAAFRHRVAKLLYLASSCVYPKFTPQPMPIAALMTGPLEPTNEAYATAKLAGLKLCEAYRRQHGMNFISAIPANPFGPWDDFDPETGHVISALMRRMHLAKLLKKDELTIWGTGTPQREFIYSEDLADACLFLMKHYDAAEPINVGSRCEHSIAKIAGTIAEVVGYRGRLVFDPGQPDGMPRKALDAEKLFRLGWRPAHDFRTALEKTYAWFLAQQVKEDTRELRTAV